MNELTTPVCERLLSQPDGSCAAVLTRQLTNTVIVLAGHWSMGWGRETTLLGGVKATAFEGRGYVSAVAGRMALLVYLLDLYRREHCWGEVRTGWLCS